MGDDRSWSVILIKNRTMISDERLINYLLGESGERERRRIEKWISDNPLRQQRLNRLGEMMEGSFDTPESQYLQMQEDWSRLLTAMKSPPASLPLIRKTKVRLILKVAAVMLVLVASGLFWLLKDQRYAVPSYKKSPREIILSDGSRVTLMPGSRLISPARFPEKARLVKLSGEASFDVQSDYENPFIVKTGQAMVEVTGTKFQVSALRNCDEVEVQVESGKVLFYNSNVLTKDAFRVGLGAGEKGIYSASRKSLDKFNDFALLGTP